MKNKIEKVKEKFNELDGPAAFDFYIFLLFSISSLWVTLVVDFGQSGNRLAIWLLAGFISLGCALMWLALAKALTRPLRGKRWTPSLILFFYAGTGAIRFFTLAISCSWLSLPVPNSRIAVSALASVLLLSFANATSAKRRESDAIQQSLAQERQKLVWLSAKYDEKVLSAQSELERDLHRDVYPALAGAIAKLGEDDGAIRTDSISGYLSKTVADVVRPMSEQLNKASDNFLIELDEIVENPPESFSASTKFSISAALKPALTVGLLLSIGLAISPALGANSKFFLNALTSAAALLALLALKRFWPQKFDSLPMTPAAVTLSSIYLLVFTTSQFALVSGLLTQQIQLIQLSFNVGGSIVLALMALSEQRRDQIYSQYIDQIQALEKLISRLRRQIWITRRNAAWILHGPIQSALISSALSLNEPGSSKELRNTLQGRIREAVQSLQKSQPLEVNISDALDGIVNVWSRNCKTTWKIDESLVQQIQSDQELAFCVVEIVREAVSNSVRHGLANTIEVDVSDIDSGLIGIRVLDNGSGCPSNVEPGLGTAMLDQLTLTWSRTNQDLGCLLTAVIVRDQFGQI